LIVVCIGLLALLAACAAPQSSPTVTPDGQALPESTVPASPTPETTPIPALEAVTSAGPFALTQVWLDELKAGVDYIDEARLQRLAEALIADTAAYLDAAVAPGVPLAEQQPALTRMAADLPGWESGEVLPVDLDPDIETELVIGVGIGGDPLLYAYGSGGHWQVALVPWPDDLEVDPNLWPGAVEAPDLTGDGAAELVATYRLRGGSGVWDFVQVFRWTGADFVLLFRADLLTWAGESRYALESDPTQSGALQIVLTYPHLYDLGFDHKLVNHPLGRQVWRWDAGVGHFALAESGANLERSGWGADAEVTVEDRLRWLVNEGETRFRLGDYEAALPWYEQALALAEAEAWEHVGDTPHWPAFAAFRRAQLLLLAEQMDEGRAAMQVVANTWEGDVLAALAQAFLNGYGEGDAGAAERAFEAMRAAVDLEKHFYYDGFGLLRYPMTAEGILFSGVASSTASGWPRVGTFNESW
jgi:tetratricopeptide (TPR) repeat protein